MNVNNSLGFPTPAAPTRRTDDVRKTDGTEAPRKITNSVEFTAFLNMLVGNNDKLRVDLLKQLPEQGAGLLDHLLANAEAEVKTGADSNAAIRLNAGTPANGALVAASLDSVRFGLMTDTARGAANATPTVPASPTAPAAQTLPTAKPTRAELIAAARAESQAILASMQSGITSGYDNNGVAAPGSTPGQSRIPMSVLARIASRKTPSVEELLAVGDREGALARAKLDNLLLKSGTDEGRLLAASHAAGIALSAALAASADDVATPVKDMQALDPELRARVDRVIDRMKSEFGHDVTVVETARSQERQDYLYAQGRTAGGNIVTWTTDSAHKEGEAADVIVDGKWNNPEGFARLQQIAKEEGLHTLGDKDAGHLELPKEAWTNDANVRVTSASSTPAAENGVARVATVARVAQVAVAANTSGGGAPRMPQLVQPTGPVNASIGIMAQTNFNPGSNGSQTSSQSPSQNSMDGQPARRDRGTDRTRVGATTVEAPNDKSSVRSAASSADKVDPRGATSAIGDLNGHTHTNFVGPVDNTERAAGATAADAADRVQSIHSMREQQGAKPLSQITLEVDGPSGTQQITVDVKGNTVGTHINTDSASADRLRANVGELKTGLENRGLEADTVRISSPSARAAGGTDGVAQTSATERDAMRLTGAGTSGGATTGDQTTQQGPRDKSNATRDWEDRQAARDEQRAQNRDAQGRGSGNQDRQRPQYQEMK